MDMEVRMYLLCAQKCSKIKPPPNKLVSDVIFHVVYQTTHTNKQHARRHSLRMVLFSGRNVVQGRGNIRKDIL
jgi:hypothetical protein